MIASLFFVASVASWRENQLFRFFLFRRVRRVAA
jgi:hypothetical protein